MKKPVPVKPRTSLRWPLKSCGLFDNGLAGGTHDATSFEHDAPTDLIGYSCLIQDLVSDDIPIFDEYMERKLDNVRQHLVHASLMPDQLSDIEIDQPANCSLDAFINLDQILDLLCDDVTNTGLIMTIPAPDKSIHVSEECSMSSSNTSLVSPSYLQQSPSDPFNFEPANDRIFEIPLQENLASDHDFLAQYEIKSTLSENFWKQTSDCDSQRTPPFESSLSSSDSSTSLNSLDSHLEAAVRDQQTPVRRKSRAISKQQSREQRKPKYSYLDDEAVRLTEANVKLRQKIIELEALTKEMKAQLIARIVGS